MAEVERDAELEALRQGARFAHSLGLEVHAGHGLDYDTARTLARVPAFVEFDDKIQFGYVPIEAIVKYFVLGNNGIAAKQITDDLFPENKFLNVLSKSNVLSKNQMRSKNILLIKSFQPI